MESILSFSSEFIFLRSWPASEDANRSSSPGVWMAPGLTAFTRMRRSFKSVVHVLANERTAALWRYKHYSTTTLCCRRWMHSE